MLHRVSGQCPALAMPGEPTHACDVLLFPTFYVCTASCFCPERISLVSLLPWAGAWLCAACGRDPSLPPAQVENPEKLLSFSSWVKPVKVLSVWADGNRLDLLAWAWVWAKMPSLILLWERQTEAEQICCCLYPYAKTSAKCGVSMRTSLRKSCPVALRSSTRSRGNLHPVVKAEDWKDTLCLLDCSAFLKEKNNFCFGNLLAYYLWKIKLFSLSFILFVSYFLHCYHGNLHFMLSAWHHWSKLSLWEAGRKEARPDGKCSCWMIVLILLVKMLKSEILKSSIWSHICWGFFCLISSLFLSIWSKDHAQR